MRRFLNLLILLLLSGCSPTRKDPTACYPELKRPEMCSCPLGNQPIEFPPLKLSCAEALDKGYNVKRQPEHRLQ